LRGCGKGGGAHEVSDSERVETREDTRDKRGTEVRIKE